MYKLKKFISFAALFLSAAIVLGTFGFNKSVKASEEKFICYEATSDKIYEVVDGEEVKLDEFVYCADIKLPGPQGMAYTRCLLTETGLDSKTMGRLMVILMEREAIRSKLDELRASCEFAAYYWTNFGKTEYLYQQLVWIALSEDDFISDNGGYGYVNVCMKVRGRVDNKDDDDSIWNQVFVPLLECIDSKTSSYPVGTANGRYNAYFYTPDDLSVQHLLGKGWISEGTEPETPDEPDTPDTPEEPETPETPEVPETPDVPSIETPDDEDEPETPAPPATSGEEEPDSPSIITTDGEEEPETPETPSAQDTDKEVKTGSVTLDNPKSDSSEVPSVPSSIPDSGTDSTAEETPAPTTTPVPSKATPNQTERTDKVTKTGEAVSYTLIAAVIAITVSGILLVIRSRRFKED